MLYKFGSIKHPSFFALMISKLFFIILLVLACVKVGEDCELGHLSMYFKIFSYKNV